MSKNFWFDEDPMMDAVTWAVLLLLATGFIFGFGVGVGLMMILL
jgi:hypothetical protein